MNLSQQRRGLVAAGVRTIVGGAVIGAMSVAFAISFVAVIYSGPLSGFLGSGIGLAMVGAAIMALLGGFLYRTNGMLCQPQETIAILLAAASARMAADATGGDVAGLGPTIATLGIVATVVAGLAALLCGQLRLGHVARYMPYPVLGGFLAASGYVLLLGAIGLCLDLHVDIFRLPLLVQGDALWRWLPWIVLAMALAIGLRIVRHDMALPFALLVITAGFYLVLALSGTTLDDASAAGLLLGPFPSGQALLPNALSLAQAADWAVILGQIPTILTVAGLCVLGTILNASGLELALDRKTDLNHDLRVTGAVNIAAAVGGGVGGYPMIGETLLAARLGLRGLAPGLAVALACGLVALFGGQVLSVLPKGLFAVVIGYLGLDLLITWLWVERRKLPHRDMAIVGVILLVAATAGILEAIAVGLAVAAVIFVLSYARLDLVRRSTTSALRRSIVERPPGDLEWLSREGDAVLILELTGYLFFGSAHALTERVQTALGTGRIRELVLDFAHVSGMDTSAQRALGSIKALCAAKDVMVTLAGMRPDVAQRWRGRGDCADAALTTRLDDALPMIEDRLLALRGPGDATGLPEFLEEIARDAGGADPRRRGIA